jgi:hypothetical protein
MQHRITAHVHRLPAPFRCFGVRSEEPALAGRARAPYGQVHQLRCDGVDAGALASLAAAGHAQVPWVAFPDIEHARTTPAALAALVPGLPDLAGTLAAALQLTGVLGGARAAYRSCIETRIDFLACAGAGFHNDVGRHWPRCLFWLLALDVAEVEFVMPHAGVRLPLAPGELLVFDQTMAHGLCRPADGGQSLAASFAGPGQRRQVFLTGELLLSEAHWAALGAPWLPVELHAERGALDLLVASFDERSGAIQRLGALRGCMQGGERHASADC